MYKLGKRSLQRLKGVNPALVKVVKRAIELSEVDFTVLEGVRSEKRQRELFKKGATRTMNSYHLTGHAVDLAPWPIDWNDTDKFVKIADAMEKAADELGVPLQWGGNWRTFVDMPHFQIPRSM